MESSRDTTSDSIFGPPNISKDGIDAASSQHLYSGASKTPTTPTTLANENVAPFLARHIPEQYAPLGSRDNELAESNKANSKYCYRHRPDLKCRRQADEPSMDKLQRVLLSLFISIFLRKEEKKADLKRTSKHSLRVTNRELHLSGHSFPPLPPSTGS